MSDTHYDPYDFSIDADPYPVWKRMRDEAPLFYNAEYDFFAVSRFDDVERCSIDWRTYISGKGSVLEIIKSGMEIPPGSILFEDPPMHDVHRSLLSRVFTPRRIAELEPKVRAFCARSLDPLVGGSGFDFIGDLGVQMPMRTIGMLLGIPEEDQEAIRAQLDAGLRLEEGGPRESSLTLESAGTDHFADYIGWRAEHPSDDLMTELLNAEFEDDTGVRRTLSREEILGYIALLAGAGNETTTRLIGWTGKVLAEHPDQRRMLVEDRSLIPNAIEELLRYEAPSPVQARYIADDVEHYGQKIAAGNVMVLLTGSGNRGRAPLPRSRPLRHHASHRPPLVVRLRHPLLPRRRARPPRGSRRARRGAGTLPRVGGRLAARRAGPHQHGARVGEAPGARSVTPSPTETTGGPAVVVAVDGPVRIVTLNRPDTLNAVDAELHHAIAAVWDELARDADARAVVLTGAGKAFSAGGDFGLLQRMVDDVAVREATIDEGKTLVRSMLALGIPIIGAVNGPAVGLGCSLVSLCDIVLIAEDAHLADPHVALGLVAADGGAIAWPFLTSLLRAKEHLILGTRIRAKEAVEAGLATRISSEPLSEAIELAHRIAQLPPQSVAETKRILNSGLRAAVASLLDDAFAAESRSFDTAELRANLARLTRTERPGADR